MTESNGGSSVPGGSAFRRTDRTDAPYYLARYAERRGLKQAAQSASPTETDADADLPLYLRRFRERAESGQGQAASAALLEVDGESFTSEFAGTTRDKEIVAPPERKPQEDFATEIRIIRHGITQGYSTDAGLTPMGGWQSHQRGHSLSKSVRPGQKVRIVCADTSRARQTADQIYRGMNDGLQQWGREADVGLAAPLRQAVLHAAVELVRGLPRPAGVGADDPDPLAGPDALGQAVTALVRLPAAHRGQAGVGRIALGDPVPDDPDLGGEVLLRLALGRRDDLLVPGGAGELGGEALAVRFEQSGALAAAPALAEPAQVQRQVGVLVRLRRGVSVGKQGLSFEISGEVVRSIGAVGPAERVASRGRRLAVFLGHQEWTVKKRSLTSRA